MIDIVFFQTMTAIGYSGNVILGKMAKENAMRATTRTVALKSITDQTVSVYSSMV